MQRYHRSLVDCKEIKPYVKELVDRCGSPKVAAEYALVGYNTIYRIMNDVHCTVQQATASKLILALKHRREEDRKTKAVHDCLLKARQNQARIEDGQQRLAGY